MPIQVMQFVERVKTEIHPKTYPPGDRRRHKCYRQFYNPCSTQRRLLPSQTAEGRGSKVETLPGGTNLGEIDDQDILQINLYVVYVFQVSFAYRSRRCNISHNDGRVGTAFIPRIKIPSNIASVYKD